jgi:F-type H+-transporting ATPase subunit a
LGIIPFFPGSTNITGSIAVTAALAITVFLVVNLSANKDYWGHILWMPGVPVFVKILLMPIELAGIFVKPFTLLIRLFANITAGHIIILSLISLMFVFGNAGESVSGSIAGGILGGALVFVINFIELMVAFLQAYIFTMLAALYIGSAVEDHHHDGTDFDHGY